MKALLLTLVLVLGAASAQVPAGTDGTEQLGQGLLPGLPPGPPPSADELAVRADALAHGMRCPVCQALSVADSNSEAARMFNDRIHELVAAGYTDDQVKDYFVDRYGEWILLDPERSGLGQLLYLMPALLLGLGLGGVGATVARWRKEPDEVPLPSDQGLVAMDEYERRLLEELDE